MHTARLIIVATFFIVLVQLIFTVRECSEDESTTSALTVFNSDCENSCASCTHLLVCLTRNSAKCVLLRQWQTPVPDTNAFALSKAKKGA